MAVLTKTAFFTKWTTLFANNTTGQISEARMREFMADIRDSFASELTASAPPNPDGVSWITPPTYTITGNVLTESASSLNNNGTVVNVAATQAPHITVPYAANGKKRLDAIVVNYTAQTPVYERIAGTPTDIYLTAARPAIPGNRLFVRDVEVTDGVITATDPLSHRQNTDRGTRWEWFEVQYQSQNQEQDGVSGIILRGGQGGGTDIAIANFWNALTQTATPKMCLNYTGANTDVWVDLGSGGGPSLTFDKLPTADSTNPVESGGIKSYTDTKLPIEAETATGTVITFLTDRTYGTVAVPESGNITALLTGAFNGVTNKMYHWDNVAPLLGGKAIGDNTGIFKRLPNSGSYVLGAINIIYYAFEASDESIEYIITQRP